MDYELKYVIAIFLIVKIAALSPEFSISEKKEKLEQNHGPVENPGVEETPGPSANGPLRGPYLIWEPEDDGRDEMRVQDAREDAKSEKVEESPSYDVCEHKVELLESSLKWRNIQKTLRWLNRMLFSNLTGMELCSKRKIHKPRRNFLNVKLDFVGLKKSFSKRKRTKQGKRLNDVRASRFPGEEKRIKRKRKYKHKSRRNLSKNETRKLKSKWKESSHEKTAFPGTSPPQLDPTTILKPNSVLFEQIFLKKAKNKSYCPESLARHTERNCVETRSSKASQKPERPKEGWSGKLQEATGHVPDNKLPKPKAKPWPHFVYHRVSSNFLHPELAGHSHKQSAYVAISVATPSKPEATENT